MELEKESEKKDNEIEELLKKIAELQAKTKKQEDEIKTLKIKK